MARAVKEYIAPSHLVTDCASVHAGKCAHACVVCTYICVHWAPARVAYTLKVKISSLNHI